MLQWVRLIGITSTIQRDGSACGALNCNVSRYAACVSSVESLGQLPLLTTRYRIRAMSVCSSMQPTYSRYAMTITRSPRRGRSIEGTCRGVMQEGCRSILSTDGGLPDDAPFQCEKSYAQG